MRRLALIVAALGCCAATGASSPVTELAGRYDQSFTVPIRDANGKVVSYDHPDNVVEIVPVSPRVAYVRAELIGGSEDICSIAVFARSEHAGLVYSVPRQKADEPTCTLRISHVGKTLRLENGAGDDCSNSGFCGVGADVNVSLPWRSKRPITYMARLKASPEYRDALTEWRTGKPANP